MILLKEILVYVFRKQNSLGGNENLFLEKYNKVMAFNIHCNDIVTFSLLGLECERVHVRL